MSGDRERSWKSSAFSAFCSSHLRFPEDASRYFIDILVFFSFRALITRTKGSLLDESAEIRLLSVSRFMRVSTNALEDSLDERTTSSKEIKEKMAGKGEVGKDGLLRALNETYIHLRDDGTLPRYTSHEYGGSRASRQRWEGMKRGGRHFVWNRQDYFLSVYSTPSGMSRLCLFISSFPREWVKPPRCLSWFSFSFSHLQRKNNSNRGKPSWLCMRRNALSVSLMDSTI